VDFGANTPASASTISPNVRKLHCCVRSKILLLFDATARSDGADALFEGGIGAPSCGIEAETCLRGQNMIEALMK
jgi:hypothetical protein